MQVTSLGLIDFRSYERVDLTLDGGITTFVGRNGQGKTNLIEAIGYASTLGSHRVANDGPLVRSGADTALVSVGIRSSQRDALIDIAITPGKANKARINRSPVPRTRDVIGMLRTVLFAPEDLALIKGDPSDRRAFVDDLLVQRAPRLAGVKADYDRVLKQRNALLKSSHIARGSARQAAERTLEIWDEQLADFGADILHERIRLLDQLQPFVADAYAQVSADPHRVLTCSYATAITEDHPDSREGWRECLMHALGDRRREEFDRGVTLIGPHRDDVRINLGDQPAKGYASHGESWSGCLSMRLAAFRLHRQDGEDPVLILDDVFAELDARRRDHLCAQLTDAEQVLITAAVDADVPLGLDGARWIVEAGRVTPE